MEIFTKVFSYSRYLILLFLFSSSFAQTVTLNGSYPVGITSAYKNLKQVSDSITNSNVTGNVIFELQADYNGTINEIFPIVFKSYNSIGGPWTITIRPASGVSPVTAGDPGSAVSLIELNGINNLILDGRPGGTGSSSWTIRNTRNTVTIGPVISFINDARFNNITYLNIEGQNNSTSSGLILFSTTTGTEGNSNNTLSNSTIHDRLDVTGIPSIGIYSFGTNTARNKNNKVLSNQIFNWNNFGVNISPTGNGEGWEISGNSFYNNLSTNNTGQTSIMFLAGASSFSNIISSNYIGGQAPLTGGSAWTNSAAAAFNGIVLNIGNLSQTIVSNNIIRNFNLSSLSTVSFTGISLLAGSADLNNNTIGQPGVSSSITSSGSSLMTGINSSSSGNVTIQNNIITSLNGTGPSTGAQVRGIASSGTGSANVSNNNIFDLTSASSTTSTTTASISGIYIGSSSSNQLYFSNTISNLKSSNPSVGTFTAGFSIVGSGTGTLERNKINSLSNLSSSTAAGILGIVISAGNWTIINSQISLDANSDISLRGISDNSPATSSNNIFFNSIFLNGSGNSVNKTYAFVRTGGSSVNIKNNFFYNNRTGALNFAIGNTYSTPSTGWGPGASNNNYFVTANPAIMGEWGSTSYRFMDWKIVSESDVFSYYETNTVTTPSVFVNANTGDLKISPAFAAQPSTLESRGVMVAGIITDFEGDQRPGPVGSVNGGGQRPDIGADEFDGVPLSKDVGVTSLLAPSILSCPGTSEIVQVNITNFGPDLNLTTNNITVTGAVTGPNASTFSPVTLNTGIFTAGSTMTVTLSTAYNMSAPGVYTFYSKSMLSGDLSASNDSMPPVNMSMDSLVNLPQSIDFTGFTGTNLNSLFAFWKEAAGSIPTGNTSLWTNQNNFGTTGNTTAKVNLFSTGKKEWILGPKFTATANTKLRYKVAITDKGSVTAADVMGSDDLVQVMLSTDCGRSWFAAQTFNKASNLLPSLTSQVVDLAAYNGQNIMLGFYATDGTIDDIEDYDFHIDNIIVSDSINGFDLSVTSLLSPVTTGCYSANETITVRVKNFGPETINFSVNNATITANITGPLVQSFTTVITSGILLPYQDTVITVTTTFNMTQPGTYNINVSSSINPDYEAANNTLTVTRVNTSPFSLPDNVNFTGYTGANLNTVFPNWSEANGTTPTGTTSTWASATGLNSAGNITAKINLDVATHNEWILSKKFIPSSTTKLKFSAAVTDYLSLVTPDQMGSDDAVSVMLSTNCGVSWFPVFVLNKTNALTTTLTPFEVDLSAYAGAEVMVAFYATDGPIDNVEDYDFHLDNIEIRDFHPIDLGSFALVTPTANICTGPAETITISVKNYGVNTINFSSSPATITANVTGASTQAFSTTLSTGTVAPDSLINVIVTTSANFTATGTHFVNSTTTISSDGNNMNNSFKTSASYSVTTVSNFPYTESFEAATIPGWSIQQISGNGNWAYVTGAGTNPALTPFTGTKKVSFNSNANTFYQAVSRLSSTCLNFTNVKAPRLEFYLSQDNKYPFNKDSLFIVVSTDGGSTWSNPLLSVSRYNPAYSTPGWKKFSLCLDQYAQMSGIKIGFVAKSAFGSNIYLDEIIISDTPRPFAGFISSTENLICGGGKTFLNLYSYSGTIQWQSSLDDLNFSNIAGGNFDTLTSPVMWDTTYYRMVTTFNNICTVRDSSTSLRVDVLPAPQVELGSDTTICGNLIILDAGIQDPSTTFEWQDGSTSQVLSATASGKYYVTATSDFFCQTSDTINITIKTPVFADAGVDQTICSGDNVVLTASGGDFYSWSNGELTASISVSPSDTTKYYVQVSSSNGCSDIDSLTVNVNNGAIVNLGNDIIQCGGSVILNAGTGVSTYLWSSGESTPSITVSNTGTYFVTTTKSGCSSSDTISVTLNPVPSVNLGTDIVQCGGSVELNAGNVNSSYIWSTGQISQKINVTSSGLYHVTVTNSFGCIESDTINVIIKTSPQVNLGPDISSCSSSVVLQTSETGNYLWSTGQTSSSITVTSTNQYWLQVEQNGCVSTDTINVIINPSITIDLGPDISTCSGSVTLDATGTGLTYLWNNGLNTPTIDVTNSGTYIVTVSNAGGCTVKDSVNITIHPAVAANAGADQTICEGSNVQLSASGGVSYLWNGSLSGQTINVNPTTNTTYTVLVTDINGCSATDQVNVLIKSKPVAAFNTNVSEGVVTITNTSVNSVTNVWDFGDGSSVDFSDSPIHTYSETGNYNITLYAINNCGIDSLTKSITIVTIGISEHAENEKEIKIYPIPASEKITIEVDEKTTGDIEANIYSINGSLVMKAILNEGNEKNILDVSTLSTGVYLLQLTNSKDTYYKRIIIQN